MTGPLNDLRVIELCDEAGAWAGKMLADLGADVIKVEPPAGNITRQFGPFYHDEPHPDRSLTFWHNNTSKRGITLNLEHANGREVFRRLVAGADMLIEDQAPGRMAALSLDYPDLRVGHEGLIMVSLTPFGRSGPRSEEQATDLTIIANGGPGWMCGYDDHTLPPVRGGGNQAYQTGSMWAVISALTALMHRDFTGEGQHFDVNMNAAMNVTTEAASVTWLVAQKTVQRQTGRHAGVVPSAPVMVAAKDGRLVTTGAGARRPERIAALLVWLEELGLKEQFDQWPLLEVGGNLDHEITLNSIAAGGDDAMIFSAVRDALTLITEHLSAYDFFVGSQKRDMQTGIIYTPDEAVEDPHIKARGFPVEVEHPELGERFIYPGAPFHLPASPWEISRRAPLLGEHTAEVLREAGIGDAEQQRLRTAGVV